MASNDYKLKYLDLREKFLNAVDVAFKMGYENGAKDTTVQMQAQQAQQMAADAQAAKAAADASAGQPGQEQPDQGGEVPQEGDEAQPQPDQQVPSVDQDLDQQLGQLQGMTKTEKKVKPLKKGELKPMHTIEISHPHESKSSFHNLDNKKKAANHLQKQLVDNILKKMEEEAPKAAYDILNIVKK